MEGGGVTFRLLDATPAIERCELLGESGFMERLFKCHTCAALVHETDIEEHMNWHRKHDEIEPVVR